MVSRPTLIYYWIAFVAFLCISSQAFAQNNLYTARGYWEESTKPVYANLLQKLSKGDSLTSDELNYVSDYEEYLKSYFKRLPQQEKENYYRSKVQWDKEIISGEPSAKPEIQSQPAEFEWRGRDRLANGLFGLYYGSSLVVIANIKNAPATGIPLITGGLWMLGPAFNPKKYESITRNTIRASNTGKLLGLGYGYALSAAIFSNENSSKWNLGISTVASIAAGEIAFHAQKRKNYSAGRIELVRHYGFLGPWVGLTSVLGAGSENSRVSATAIVAGGVAGILIGHQEAKKYDYTRGDVDAISSLTLASTGIGLAVVAESLKSTSDINSLIFIPAGGSILATILGQRAVRGARLTDKQGSTINLSAAGAALIGLGAMAVTESESPTLWVGVPSILAMIAHQTLFHKYKTKNIEEGIRGEISKKKSYSMSFKLTPESYFLKTDHV